MGKMIKKIAINIMMRKLKSLPRFTELNERVNMFFPILGDAKFVNLLSITPYFNEFCHQECE